jgi:hypothetical protein
MTYEEFKKRWSDYDFEATLKYVSIANIKFKRDKSVSQVTKQSRDDATHIIRWLLTHKKVKRILNVTVDDMGSNYHSNESIEKALKGAKVEILDWKRPDLCPATIFKIGSNLRELHLHWGGNNAILRAWSEAEGLPMLAQSVLDSHACCFILFHMKLKQSLDPVSYETVTPPVSYVSVGFICFIYAR